ncbi:MAG: hypothetical protein HY297_04995 [Thaumarchaeota archaeon]|nr:hypothetical protein [Nitrososphaerota archaeon]
MHRAGGIFLFLLLSSSTFTVLGLGASGAIPGLPFCSYTARTAFVKPSFTITPYGSNHSFYTFYRAYRNLSAIALVSGGMKTFYVTSDLDMFTTSVDRQGWGNEGDLYELYRGHLANCGAALALVDDVSVDAGALFAPDTGRRNFDTVILGHEEYVTLHEYDQFRRFVFTGGRLVEASANQFFGLITYDSATGKETYVRGHDWIFNGTVAWTRAAPYDRFLSRTNTYWFGSEYHGHRSINGIDEEFNIITNFTNILRLEPPYTPAYNDTTYIHGYGRGLVVCLCVAMEDQVGSNLLIRSFLKEALTMQPPRYWPPGGILQPQG